MLIKCEDGNEVLNYPEQNLSNSTKKNNDTNYYYKKIVRILKNIKHDLEDADFSEAFLVSSYGLESLIYNVPNSYFGHKSYYLNDEDIRDITKNVVEYLYINRFSFELFTEPNEIINIFDNKNNKVAYFRDLICRMREELK